MRKLATIRRIDSLTPIEGADKIELATVGGWKVVAQKGLYNEGDLAVYFEIDSWIPSTVAPFLTKPGHFPKVFEGVEGERLKTIKLRGQLSQGLLMPVHNDITGTYLMIYTDETGEYSLTVAEGDDVTEALGIKKWEKAIPAQLAGVCKGNFPSLIPKTDQERCQNLKKEINGAVESCAKFEVTEKLEGSSMTVYLMTNEDGTQEFGVCSRNLNLKETEGNAFWATARAEDIEEKMRKVLSYTAIADFAIQGELIGPGVQGNIYKLEKLEFRVFDVYNINQGRYLNPGERQHLISFMGMNHVPVINPSCSFEGIDGVETLLVFAEGESALRAKQEREGLVFKEVNGGMTFKAISNKYLLGEK